MPNPFPQGSSTGFNQPTHGPNRVALASAAARRSLQGHSIFPQACAATQLILEKQALVLRGSSAILDRFSSPCSTCLSRFSFQDLEQFKGIGWELGRGERGGLGEPRGQDISVPPPPPHGGDRTSGGSRGGSEDSPGSRAANLGREVTEPP